MAGLIDEHDGAVGALAGRRGQPLLDHGLGFDHDRAPTASDDDADDDDHDHDHDDDDVVVVVGRSLIAPPRPGR